MNEEFCATCNSKLKLTLTPNMQHHERLDCPLCNFVGWARNPHSPRNKGTKLMRVGNRLTVEKIMAWHRFLGEPFCFMCLRKRGELGVRETLTADHILELKDTEKGQNRDDVKNGQILCTACHKKKLWLTTYLNEHIREKYGEMRDDTNTTMES